MTTAPHTTAPRAPARTSTRSSTIEAARSVVTAMWPLVRWQMLGWIVTAIVLFAAMMIVSTQVVVDPTIPMSHMVLFTVRIWIVVIGIVNVALYFTLLVGQGVTRSAFVLGMGAQLAFMAVVGAILSTIAVGVEQTIIPTGLDWAADILPRLWSDPAQLAIVWLDEVTVTVAWGLAGWAVTALWYRFGWMAGLPAIAASLAVVAVPYLISSATLALVAMWGVAAVATWIVHRVTVGTALHRSSPWVATAGG
ncbi:MAG TPA: hypothetical protein VJ978_16485 [Nitriliruptoraceae bacterium]|nr:hypothetical protein [Nitriliruptoraceae bacterium]